MIVLTILKVIGMVLLVILLLILLLLGILLFVPVRYRSLGYKREESTDYYIDFNATWLMKALRFKAAFDPGGLKMNLKFLWLTLMDSSDDEALPDSQAESPGSNTADSAVPADSTVTSHEDDTSDVTEPESSVTEPTIAKSSEDTAGDTEGDTNRDTVSVTVSASDVKSDSTITEPIEISEVKTDSDTDSVTDIISTPVSDSGSDSPSVTEAALSPDSGSDIISDLSEHVESYASEEADKASSEDTDKASPKEAVPTFTEKIVKKFRSILGKIEDVSAKTAEIKAAVNDEENRAAVKLIAKNLKYLLRHYRFRTINGNLTYGSEDPSSVGTVMMYLSMLYPVYGENFTIEPVFDRSVITGDMKFKGRIRLIHLLIALIELMLNKKIRQFVINRL